MASWNKEYMSVSGVFTGSGDADFELYINNLDTLVWKYRENGVWSSTTSPAGHVTTANWDLNTNIALGSTGISVKLTRTTKGSYNTGDKWTWTEYAILQLSTDSTDALDTLAIIERSDKRDLIALGSSSGTVAVVEDFEGANPTVVANPNINIGSSTSIDICHKNKELFIAGGKGKSPKFLGYTKNIGFDGVSSDFSLVEDNAYEQIDSESFDAKAMNDFVFLRGFGTSQGAGTLCVGIEYGNNQLFIWNKADSKVYTFQLQGDAIRIRPDVSKNETISGEYVVNGVAVLTTGQNGDYINAIECWSIPCDGNLDGQGANLDRTIDVAKPTANQSIETFTDFLIVSSHFDRASASAQFDIIMSASLTGSDKIGSACVFKTENFDTASTISSAPFNISPSLDYSDYGAGGTRFVSRKKNINFRWVADPNSQDSELIREEIGTSYSTIGGVDAKLDYIQDICLSFAGYGSNGLDPVIHFTARIKNHENKATTGNVYNAGGWNWQFPFFQTYSNQWIHYEFGPFWEDSSGEFLMVKWITFVIPVSATTPTKGAKLLHLMDYNNQPHFFSSYSGSSGFTANIAQNMVDNYAWPPDTNPNYCKDGLSGVKCQWIGDKDDNGVRFGLTVTFPYTVNNTYSRVFTFKTPYSTGSDHLWNEDGIWIYPNQSSNTYAVITSGDLSAETRPTLYVSRLDSTTTVDSRRWQIGETDYGMTITTVGTSNSAVIGVDASHKMMIMAGVEGNFTGGKISEYSLNASDNSIKTNLLANTDGWITLGTPVPNAAINWSGGATKKIFYRVSLVYDGYQESTLLTVQQSYYNATSFVDGFTMLITLSESWVPPDRVASISVYRADDTADVDSPAGLYRFVEEVPLVAFSEDSTSGDYTYSVRDDGSTQGSYGALNGIAETLTSLYLEYTVCASLNGYMFAGNCRHPKFDSAENYIFRSQPGKFSTFDWSKDFAQLDFIPKAIAGFMGKLYIFGDSKTSILNPETLIIEDEIDGVGCVGPKALKITPTGIYWFDQNNIYSANPQIKKLGTTILKQEEFGWAGLTFDEKSSAVSGYDSNRHNFLVYFTKGGDNRVWSYSITTNRWDLWETDYRVYDTVQSNDGHAILLMDNGRITKHLGGDNKRDWEWVSKKLSLGAGTVIKKIKSLKIDSTTRTGVGLTYKTNDNNTAWQSGTDNSARYFNVSTEGLAKKVATNDSKVRWVQAKITGENDQSASNVLVKSLAVVYKPKRPK
tara:strand:- start:1097 stop:4789 length:3693 start_codon:yes stop_codon:yes gene_type:complete